MRRPTLSLSLSLSRLPRPPRVLRAAATAAALAAALLPATAAPATAEPASSRSSGEVCFYSAPGQQGASWCYRPPGYADVPDYLHDRTAAFQSSADVDVYAINWTRGGCVYRLIRPADFSDNWDFGAKLDGASHTPMDCQQG